MTISHQSCRAMPTTARSSLPSRPVEHIEPDDQPDDHTYPPAPVPPHERGWRHPSEVGATQWATSEPPLALGRGLMTATGTIGVVLAGALVWAMLPSSGAPVTATSSVLAASATTISAPTPTSVALVEPTTTAGATPPTTPATTLATISPTTPTVAPPAVPVVAFTDGGDAMATSIVVGDQVFLITTIVAVGTRERLTVRGNDGSLAVAQMVWSDQASGLAVLAAPAADVAESVATGALPAPGTDVSVMSATGLMSASLTVDTAGTAALGGIAMDSLVEGSPVVDTDGRVVGLCSGARVVPVQLPAAVLERLAELRGWLGVRLVGSADDTPIIGGIEAGGPADAAGLQPGDEVLAIDERSVTSVADVQWMIARHLPGDTVNVDVLRGNEIVDDVSVELAARPTSL
jgi:S1-C subfamily serine protease